MQFVELKSGTSVQGEPILAYLSETKGNRYIYLMAGVHGDEVEGVYVLQQLFDWLQNEEDLNLPMVVVPILNVDGYRSATRVNGHGVDLNRNLPTTTWDPNFKEKNYNPGEKPLSEPENQFLNKLFLKYHPGIIFSFHSWKPILNFNGDCQNVADFIHQYNNYPVMGDIGYPTPGSLGTYGPEKFQCPVLTYECPKLSEKTSLQTIWEENKKGMQSILASPIIKSFLQKK